MFRVGEALTAHGAATCLMDEPRGTFRHGEPSGNVPRSAAIRLVRKQLAEKRSPGRPRAIPSAVMASHHGEQLGRVPAQFASMLFPYLMEE